MPLHFLSSRADLSVLLFYCPDLMLDITVYKEQNGIGCFNRKEATSELIFHAHFYMSFYFTPGEKLILMETGERQIDTPQFPAKDSMV